MASDADPRPAPATAPPGDADHWAFGDGPALADALLSLVLAGVKTATCWDAREGDKGSVVGKRSTIVDGAGTPRAVVETVELTLCAFDAVDADFAHAEGEGDRSLAGWRRAHRVYFERQGYFADDMTLWCERFRLVERL